MKHYQSLNGVNLKDSCLTIGTFDGLHLGHQEIIRQLTAGARESDMPAVVLTFHPPPAMVLGKRRNPQYLSTQDEVAGLLEGLGVDVLITHPFDREVSKLTAGEFLARLKAHLGFGRLWIGYDFAMGRNREGDAAALEKLGSEMDFQVHVVGAVELDSQVVSSSRIRGMIAEGQVVDASRLLGRPYRLGGVVVRGEGRGKTIGIPTANLEISQERAMPGNGVYVCRALFSGRALGAAVNVGVRPTFDGRSARVTVEAHLLDFDGDLYGTHMSLDFLQRLRGERQFPDPQSLVAQIQTDIGRVRQVLLSGAPAES